LWLAHSTRPTHWIRQVNPQSEDLCNNAPLGRVGTPEEVARAAYLFCPPESNFISGQHIICGGGLTI